MREIKFRAWDSKNKKMRMVEELSFEKDGSIHGLLEEGRKNNVGRIYLGEPTQVDVGNCNHPEGYLDDYPLMQYTGLHDKNGKEIYEGDILKRDNDIRLFYIEYVGRGFAFFPQGILGKGLTNAEVGLGARFEVIGNIYKNPELAARS